MSDASTASSSNTTGHPDDDHLINANLTHLTSSARLRLDATR